MAIDFLPVSSGSPQGARWIAFLSGIVYGYQRLNYLTAKEKVIHEREDIIRTKNKEISAERKRIASIKAMDDVRKAVNQTSQEAH